jgi:hypothetical protein
MVKVKLNETGKYERIRREWMNGIGKGDSPRQVREAKDNKIR